MTLLQEDSDDEDEALDAWMKVRPFRVDEDDFIKFWATKLGNPKEAQLAQLALDLAAVSAMSSDCERVFPGTKLHITGQRNRLKVDVIEATQCLRNWLVQDRTAAGLSKGKGTEVPNRA